MKAESDSCNGVRGNNNKENAMANDKNGEPTFEEQSPEGADKSSDGLNSLQRKPERKRATKTPAKRKRKPTRIVGIGASAGGLNPVERFFDSMPTDSGMAFVVVQHLSPDFRSMMDQLLARHSSMSIVHAQNDMRLERNVVYLNPPRIDLTIKDGKLQTRGYTDEELLTLPIDSFFQSLALDQKENAIGIILSGTGSDGSVGGQAIRDAGGTMIVQEPASAKFDSMPRTAVNRGISSVTALPQDMAEILKQIAEGTLPEEELLSSNIEDGDPEEMILSLLQRKYGADFGYYKNATVGRRIRRRAQLSQIGNLSDYASFVSRDQTELELLYCDLLIGVTAFFRDKDAYDYLEGNVLPELMTHMSGERPLRIWSAGCASGEEPYSLAILISELARANSMTLNVKIFATDLHFNSLEFAGVGVYSAESLQSMPPELIRRYFEPIGDRFHIKQFIRKCVVFSNHNLIKDPPFTRMDMVTCRNLLIYFNDIAQQKVLALFHFALRQAGILFLGPSETIGGYDNEFETISKKWRIYKKLRDVRLRESTELLPLNSTDEAYSEEHNKLQVSRRTSSSAVLSTTLERQSLLRAYDKILEKYAPAAFLLNLNGDLLHVFGDADAYLEVKSGKFTQKLVDLIDIDVRYLVVAGIERALSVVSQPFRRRLTRTKAGAESATVFINVEKLQLENQPFEYLLVSIEKLDEPQLLNNLDELDREETDQKFYSKQVAGLQHDLKMTEESLQSTIEELETSNEELQATNEELMASNEELQSTNEELHSVNEELYTVSAEHQRKIEELTQLTDDMDNLLRATDIGTVFLDSELSIRRFTPAAAQTFNLIEHDIGRPLEHITYRFSYKNLLEDVRNVRDKGGSLDRRIDVDGYAYLLRILPYQIGVDEHAGAVLTVFDIQELEETQSELASQKNIYESVIQQQSEIICRYTRDLKLTFVNQAFCAYFDKPQDDLLGGKIVDLFPSSERAEMRKSIKALKAERSFQSEHESKDAKGRMRTLQWVQYAITNNDGEISEIQAVGHDITEPKKANQKLRNVLHQLTIQEERFRMLYQSTPVMMYSANLEGIIVDANEYLLSTLGYQRGDVVGKPSTNLMATDTRETYLSGTKEELWHSGQVTNMLCRFLKSNGEPLEVQVSAVVQRDGTRAEDQALVVIADISSQIFAERELERQNHELVRINENLNQFTHIVSHDLTGPLRAIKNTSDWIEEDLKPDARKEVQEHLDRVKEQVGHLNGMLSDLLNYSRTGVGQQSIEEIDLASELNLTFDVLEKPDAMTLSLHAIPETILTNHAPFTLVFRNLIENAVKYHDREDGKISVSCQDRGDYWRFSIEDNGPGIPIDKHETIFLPFRKLKNNKKQSGNGMGLALVKKAIEVQGGTVEIHSNPTSRPGTRFEFTWMKQMD